MFQSKQFISNYIAYLHLLRNYSVKPELRTLAQKRKHYGDMFPAKFLNKKHKSPDYMYIANESTAHNINTHLLPFFKQSGCDTIMELNPGIGALTHRLLDNEEQFKKILLMEPAEHFINNLQEMHTLYPDRVKVQQADFVNIWKLVYQDKIDNGSRLQELLRHVPVRKLDEDPNMLLFGAIGSYQFFKQMINSMVFHNSFLSLGRTEMYLVVPPPIYVHLTCTKEIGYLIYRSTSILFKILFEHRFITRLPRDDFLPTQIEYNCTKGSKLSKVQSINPEFLYLVRIVPRKDIHKFVDPEDLPALWYFVKQNCVSRSNRIIPCLEKWVPGCGPRLIINATAPTPSIPLYDDVANLPKYSSRCHTINNTDYPKINIYTQFGDLTSSQMLTLFSLFRQWPEYKDSSFLASFENSMLKIENSDESSVGEIIEEDDDLALDQNSAEEETSRLKSDSSNLTVNRGRKTKK